jgi:hypothetical protein
MTEVVAVLVGVCFGAVVAYFSERAHRRADRRTDAYVEGLATLQTARDAYARVAGRVGYRGEVQVGSDVDLNRVRVRLDHDGRTDAVNAYQDALIAANRFHEAMQLGVEERGDPNAQAQYKALEAFDAAVADFTRVTVPRRARR